jgi:anti-sigma-K factor RskA
MGPRAVSVLTGELHDLAAAYALNALEPEDRWTYERHLDTCETCRAEVAALREGAEQLAYAGEGPEPRPELRERILRAAREEATPQVVPFRQRRWVLPLTAAAAVAASIAAVGLGLWGNSLRGGAEQRVVPMTGGAGRVVVSGDRAQLVTCVRQAPPGKTYEAWVIEGDTPRPAGLFRGGCTDVPLSHPVESGNTVAVTLEPAGGVDRPTGDILLSANV